MYPSLSERVKLHNGVEMPTFGLGTYLNDSCAPAVSSALQMGYRLIDTASMYGNEREVGKAVKESGIPREDIFISSKYYPTRGYEDALESFERTRSELGVEYLDLYLIHWPGGGKKARLGSWKALEELYKQGKIKAIGVSNYLECHLEEIKDCESLSVTPMVNQCEFHVRNQYRELRAYCKFRGIVFMSYMPFGGQSAPLLRNNLVLDISNRTKKAPSQVILNWIRRQDIICIPKTTSKERMKENADIEFTIDDKDFHSLCNLDQEHHFDWDPNSVSCL